ncbi:hypothetical protein STEG23_031453, partial [Scotinomys teguina]
MAVTPLGRDQDCSLKNRERMCRLSWFLDPGGWSKTAAVRLYFIFPGICTLSLKEMLDMVAHAFNPSTQESEAGDPKGVVTHSLKTTALMHN